MSISRNYFVDSGLINITGSTAVPALYIAPPSSADANICRIRCSIEAVSSPAPPSNGSVFFSLNKVTGTKAGGAAVTPNPIGQSALAAAVVWSSGSTALTGLTQSTEYWCQPVPFASGASWEDSLENTGFERNIPASGTYAFYFIAASGFGSGCAARITVDYSE